MMFLFLVSVFQILFSSNDLYASSFVKRENTLNQTEMYVEGLAPKTLFLSQLKDTEWRQISEIDRGYSRIVRITLESAVWSVIESGTKQDVSNEEYYLTDEEPLLPPGKDQFYFDHTQVGKNTEGKYIMVYEKDTDTTRYYIVKDYDSSHLYLEVPASYLIHNGEKVYMSKSWVMTLEKVK